MGQEDLTFIILTTSIIVITLNQGPALGHIPGPVLVLRVCESPQPHAGQVVGQEPTGRHHSGSHDGVVEGGVTSHMCVISLSVQQVLSVITIIVSTHHYQLRQLNFTAGNGRNPAKIPSNTQSGSELCRFRGSLGCNVRRVIIRIIN